MRVTVMGSGGTGGYFGGLLARAGEDVTFIARGAHLAAIRENGLTVRSRLVGDFRVPARATDDPAESGPADLVLFCVKAYDTESAAERLRPALGPDTVILPVQNGVDSAERIGRVVGADHVIAGLAGVSSVVAAPGIIEHRAGPDVIQLGELDRPPSARAERIADTLRRAGTKAQVRPDMRVALWEKFVLICGLSGLTALTRLPVGAVLACPETRTLFRQVMEETEAVGRAEGAAVTDGHVERMLQYFQGPIRRSAARSTTTSRPAGASRSRPSTGPSSASVGSEACPPRPTSPCTPRSSPTRTAPRPQEPPPEPSAPTPRIPGNSRRPPRLAC
jgi:2-dehydropantoate 2-reductase